MGFSPLLPCGHPEMPDYTLNGSPLIVKNTFIDLEDSTTCSSRSSSRTRSRSLPLAYEASSPTETLMDVRCRCFGSFSDSSDEGSATSQCSTREHEEVASPRSRSGSKPASESEGPMTTVVLRNLPEVFNRDMLLEMLDSNGFTFCYDFVYLPLDFGSRCSFGYAFINLVNPEEACRFVEFFQGFDRWVVPCEKTADVTWSGKRQGLENQVDRYRNSPMMHPKMPDEAKPIVLKDGVRVDFPSPTRPMKPLRVRSSKTKKAHDLGLEVIGDNLEFGVIRDGAGGVETCR